MKKQKHKDYEKKKDKPMGRDGLYWLGGLFFIFGGGGNTTHRG